MKHPWQTSWMPVLLALMPLAALADLPAEPVPLLHVELVASDGSTYAECLVAQQMEAAGFETEMIALVRTAEGDRGRLSWRFDPEEGALYQEMHDLSSGWRAEWVQDFGIGDLGDIDDFADPMEWAMLNEAQRETEAAPATHHFTTSDGIFVEWTVPSGESEDQALQEILPTITAAVARRPLPASARIELALLHGLLGRPSTGELDVFERFIDTLWRADRAAAGVSAGVPGSLEVRALANTKPFWVGEWSRWWGKAGRPKAEGRDSH